MRPGETLLEMARRHVREGAAHVTRQREIYRDLDAAESPMASEAFALLRQFEASQREHQRHLAQIEDEQLAGLRDPGGELLPRLP